MAKSGQKIMLKQSRELAFNKPVFKSRVSIEGLAVIRRPGLGYVAHGSVALSDEEIATLAERAEGLLAEFGWLSEPLLTRGHTVIAPHSNFPRFRRLTPGESASTGYKTAMADPEGPAQDEPVATELYAVAAEKGVLVHKRPAGNGGPFGLGARHVHASI